VSYEGYVEWLCERGHKSTTDAYSDDPLKCSCGARYVWRHAVDQTNGECYDDHGKPIASTPPYPLEEIGTEERIVYVPIFRIPSEGRLPSPLTPRPERP
jgi:hypothetical protein